MDDEDHAGMHRADWCFVFPITCLVLTKQSILSQSSFTDKISLLFQWHIVIDSFLYNPYLEANIQLEATENTVDLNWYTHILVLLFKFHRGT